MTMQNAGKQGVRIGELLVESGVLTPEQVDAILEQQKKIGRPFGDLAERMFDVPAETIEGAWIKQYIQFGTEVDLNNEPIDLDVLRVLNRRQAWQFRLLPLRYAGDELVVATAHEDLTRAVNFAWRRINDPVFFLIAQRPQLDQFLQRHYPWRAMEQMRDLTPAV